MNQLNIALFLPVLSKALGRDLTPEANMFFRSRAAVGTVLDGNGREYFKKNWRDLPDFLETDLGKEKLKDLLETWIKSKQI